jgi:RNA polymerase primary sigma factor
MRSQREDIAAFLQESLLDHRAGSPDGELAQIEQEQRLRTLLHRLDPREAAVLRMRYGLEGHVPMTLGAIGVQLGVTGERVRQIEQAALTNLREFFQGA